MSIQKTEISHLTKSVRKSFSNRKDNDRFFEDSKNQSAPYKKPKTNFRHYLEEQLCDEDFEDDTALIDSDGTYFGEH